MAAEEFAAANKAGLAKLLEERKAAANKQAAPAEAVEAPPKEVVTGAIAGIEIMDLEDAVQVLWKNKIYAESGMGCTGPVVLVRRELGKIHRVAEGSRIRSISASWHKTKETWPNQPSLFFNFAKKFSQFCKKVYIVANGNDFLLSLQYHNRLQITIDTFPFFCCFRGYCFGEICFATMYTFLQNNGDDFE